MVKVTGFLLVAGKIFITNIVIWKMIYKFFVWATVLNRITFHSALRYISKRVFFFYIVGSKGCYKIFICRFLRPHTLLGKTNKTSLKLYLISLLHPLLELKTSVKWHKSCSICRRECADFEKYDEAGEIDVLIN